MRLTCLKCGHQTELASAGEAIMVHCVCGADHRSPAVLDMGIAPNARAAEKSRFKAFRAAGVVRNIGGFALGIALLGVLFFPLGLVGACIGIYGVTMVRGAVGFYSGRRSAIVAIVLGVAVFVAEGSLAMKWYGDRQDRRMRSVQQTATEDLRSLLRAQRLYHASRERYGTFKQIPYEPRYRHYTIYLGPDDFYESDSGVQSYDVATPGMTPSVTKQTFTAVAVTNLDSDPELDIWVLNHEGEVAHVQDDLADGEEHDEAHGE